MSLCQDCWTEIDPRTGRCECSIDLARSTRSRAAKSVRVPSEPKPEVPAPDGWAAKALAGAPDEVWVGIAPSGALMRVSGEPGFKRYEEGGGYAVIRYVRAKERWAMSEQRCDNQGRQCAHCGVAPCAALTHACAEPQSQDVASDARPSRDTPGSITAEGSGATSCASELEAIRAEAEAGNDIGEVNALSLLRMVDELTEAHQRSVRLNWSLKEERDELRAKLAEAEKATLDLWRRRDERLETVKGHWRKAQRRAENWKAAAKIFWTRWLQAGGLELDQRERAEAAEARVRTLDAHLKSCGVEIKFG